MAGANILEMNITLDWSESHFEETNSKHVHLYSNYCRHISQVVTKQPIGHEVWGANLSCFCSICKHLAVDENTESLFNEGRVVREGPLS